MRHATVKAQLVEVDG